MIKEKQSNDTLIELIDMHPFEMELVKRLRKYRFGEVVIIMKDGLPMRFKQITIIEDLTTE